MAVLVLVDHDRGRIVGASRAAVTAAERLGGPVHALVAGHGVAEVAAAASRIAGLAKVLVLDDERFAQALAEPLAALLRSLAGEYGHVVAGSTAAGRNVLPRLAALLDVQPITDVVEVLGPDTFVRPIYAGSALATVRSTDAIKVMTVRGTSFAQAVDGSADGAADGAVPVEAVAAPEPPALSRFISAAPSASERPELTGARVVVSGGRGLGNAENFRLLEPIADRLGAAIGASRAAVDAGFASNDSQVGQTGKIVAPELYMAIGISGAIQHLAGMKDSKVIVAVNKDPDAPIFRVADYGLAADLFEALPELDRELGRALSEAG